MSAPIVPSAIVLHRKTLLAGEVLEVKDTGVDWILAEVQWHNGTKTVVDVANLMVTALPGPGGWVAAS